MISICIPVYNFVVVDTVRALLKEASQRGIEVEVVVFDDHSVLYYERANRELRNLDRVSYLSLVENIGRSRIRNRMADYARGEWLLFMDCDMQPCDSAFLLRYEECTHNDVDIVCGGVYFGPRPNNKSLLLRWRADVRKGRHLARLRRAGVHTVGTGNFLIKRELFQRFRFNESLSGYGQEDQLFSMEAVRKKARVHWIDNPTLHLGEEKNHEFLRKTEESIVNLVKVWNGKPIYHRDMRLASRRLRVALILKYLGLSCLVSSLFNVLWPWLRGMVLKGNSWMGFFYFYQMAYLLRAMREPNLNKFTSREHRISFVKSQAHKW